MPTEIETKALEAACEKATDKLEIDWDGDEPFVRSDSIETAVEAAIRAYLAALDSPIGEQGVGEPALTWRVGEWGDGSTKPGEAVIFCDGMETAIAAGIARHEADKIVAEHNAAVSPERKEPVAWTAVAYMRKWAFDGEKPYKERNPRTGRMHYAPKFMFHEVSRTRIAPDDVPLYATPGQPT